MISNTLPVIAVAKVIMAGKADRGAWSSPAGACFVDESFDDLVMSVDFGAVHGFGACRIGHKGRSRSQRLQLTNDLQMTSGAGPMERCIAL